MVRDGLSCWGRIETGDAESECSRQRNTGGTRKVPGNNQPPSRNIEAGDQEADSDWSRKRKYHATQVNNQSMKSGKSQGLNTICTKIQTSCGIKTQ